MGLPFSTKAKSCEVYLLNANSPTRKAHHTLASGPLSEGAGRSTVSIECSAASRRAGAKWPSLD